MLVMRQPYVLGPRSGEVSVARIFPHTVPYGIAEAPESERETCPETLPGDRP